MVKITRIVDLRRQREGSALHMIEYQDSAAGVIFFGSLSTFCPENFRRLAMPSTSLLLCIKNVEVQNDA